MHLSLKSSLGRQILTGTYVKDNRVLDLSTPFSELTFTLADQSGEGNDATLYTGRYASTDGVADKAINADCSAAGSGNYYLAGKIKPVGTTAVANLNGSPITLTGLSAGVWQDFTSSTKTGITPDNVVVGWNGASNYSAADWSDVRLIDASDGSTVARYQLTESADGNLNGYPALDSSGNGYHGMHTGCAGGTGEAGILQTAGQDWNKPMWFAGDDDFVEVTGMTASASYFGACTISATIYVADTTATRVVWALGSGSYRTYIGGAGDWILGTTNTLVSAGLGEQTISVDYNSSGAAINFKINGVSVWTGSAAGASPSTSFYIGARDSGGATNFFKGLIYDFAITGSSVKNFAFAGTELGTWTDLNGVPANNGTVNGSPSAYLIPESSTAGTDALGNAIADPRVNSKQLNLFGDGEYALVPSNPSFQFAGPEYSIEAWVDAPAGNISVTPIISLRPSGATTPNGRYILFLGGGTPNNNISFLIDDGSAVVPSASKNTGNQQFVGVVNSTHVRLYKNGVLQDSVAHDGAWSAYVDDLYIGYDKTSLAYSDTKIGSPKIYNRALTADEVLQNFQSQKSSYGL